MMNERGLVIDLLNHALARELICLLRYRRHAIISAGRGPLVQETLTIQLERSAAVEAVHADLLSSRILELGGAPSFDPDAVIARAHASFVAGAALAEMLDEDRRAEREAVEMYGEMIQFLADRDPTTCRVLEAIREQEDEHGSELRELCAQVRISERSGRAQN